MGRKFNVITDQKSVSFMYDPKRRSKIKNDKIGRWRVELADFDYEIKYRPGKENAAADTFSRIASITHPLSELKELHDNLCHPGMVRLEHFVRSRNLPFTQDQVRRITSECSSCLKYKPRFFRKDTGTLIHAISPFQRLNIDFKGPLPMSRRGNRYLLTISDEFSRFPFAFPCKDMQTGTVVNCFNNLFSLFDMPEMVHSDRAKDFLSTEMTDYLHSRGIATSKTSRYNPQGNGQVERLNGTLWKAVETTLHSRKLNSSEWETVLPDVLHATRSLLCTSTNMTPHDRMFKFPRKSVSGTSIPSWLKPGLVYVKNHTRQSKFDPPVVPAELIEVNPHYGYVRLESGVETTVSLREIAPHPISETEVAEHPENSEPTVPLEEDPPTVIPGGSSCSPNDIIIDPIADTGPLRRSDRERTIPRKYNDYETSFR